jgi:hypothetical protein
VAASTLVLREDKPGIWSKIWLLTGVEALAALWSRRAKNRTLNLAVALCFHITPQGTCWAMLPAIVADSITAVNTPQRVSVGGLHH